MQRSAGEAARPRELAFLHLAVEVEPGDVLVAHHDGMPFHGGDIAETRPADLDGEVAHPRFGPGTRWCLGDPSGEVSAPGVGHVVHLFVGPATLTDWRYAHEPVVFHRAQRAIDLLMSGAPEEADGPVESLRELVTRTRLLGQRHQDCVCQAHGGSLGFRRGYMQRLVSVTARWCTPPGGDEIRAH